MTQTAYFALGCFWGAERRFWRLAFGLTVTLVWLYLEMLRLFAILAGRREQLKINKWPGDFHKAIFI